LDSERRRFARVPVVVAVEVTSAKPVRRFTMQTRDLGDGGAFLKGRVADLPPPGAEIQIQVLGELGDGSRPPKVRAKVVRVDADGMAVAFLDHA
jgi:hypothetical protein